MSTTSETPAARLHLASLDMGADPRVHRPIPDVGPDGVQAERPIREDGDALVTVGAGDGVHADAVYHRRGIRHAPAVLEVRAGVLAGLARVSASLPDGVDLMLWDGLRSLETQSAIVDAFRDELPPSDDREEIIDRYLAGPPASEREFRAVPPPHATGGAVDVTLCDTAGRVLDLGADHDQFDELSWLRAYEPALGTAGAADEDVARGRWRRILYWAMRDEGFSPYLSEFWHYELGTAVAAAFHGLPYARYGAAVPWPGAPDPEA